MKYSPVLLDLTLDFNYLSVREGQIYYENLHSQKKHVHESSNLKEEEVGRRGVHTSFPLGGIVTRD